jgi:hypothetical protein
MDAEKVIKEARRDFDRHRQSAVETLTDAMCTTYQAITGVPANDRLRDALHELLLRESV